MFKLAVIFTVFAATAALPSSRGASALLTLCESLGKIRHKAFQLSVDVKDEYCKSSQKTCFAFLMFSSNDFSKEVLGLKEKIGCYPEVAPTGFTKDEICEKLESLPSSSRTSLNQLFGASSETSAYKPLLNVMETELTLWMLPVMNDFNC